MRPGETTSRACRSPLRGHCAAGGRGHGSGGRRPRAPAPAIADVLASARRLLCDRHAAGGDAQGNAAEGVPAAASRTRWRTPRSASCSSSSVSIPMANATAGRIRSGHSSGSWRFHVPARIRWPPRTAHTSARMRRLPLNPGVGLQAYQHVAAVRVPSVPGQAADRERCSGQPVHLRDQQPFPVIRWELPGQVQHAHIVVTIRVTRDGDHLAATVGRTGRRRLRARLACFGARGTGLHGHSPPGSLMGWPRTPRRSAALAGPPPGGGTGNARSALHSARDVKSGRAPCCGIPPGRPVRRRRVGATPGDWRTA